MINTKFAKELKKLNEAQREAVQTIEGPVMVVAGPGTGKTQIIAMRIANILAEVQVSADNILALTFTNSGVWAMKKRLLEIIGPTSYKVHIHTFHSFCNEVILTYPEIFLFARNLEQASDLDRILIIRDILDHIDFEKIKPLKAPYHYQNAILQSINSLKQENISPEKFEKTIKKELLDFDKISDLVHDIGPSKGKIKSKYADIKNDLTKNQELAKVYFEYQKVLKNRGLYDFADMIIFVGDAFNTNKDLLSFYQEKFQYILVDEFQDTNSAQNNIVKLLASFYSEPNLFVVGDDEQSIFRFQGAALENILSFVQTYPKAKLIVLENNYRSGQKILDLSRSLIEHNQNQIFSVLKIPKKLVAQKIGLKEKIHLAHLSSGGVEDFYIAESIKTLIKNGVDPSEIACIYKEHRDGVNLAEMMAKNKIPFAQNIAQNILFDIDINKIINLLRIIADPNGDKMFETMHYPFLKIEPIDIYRLSYESSRTHVNLFEKIQDLKNLKLKKPKTVAKFSKLILESASNFSNMTFASAFEILINESGYLNYLLKLPDAPIKLNRLKTLFDEIKTINTRQKDLTLVDFILYIDQLLENNLELKEDPIEINAQAVRLLTAHQAKGLEFEYVFIFRLTDNHWGNKSARKLIKLPYGLLAIQETSDDNDEEERRLFYVALTRAKKYISISYADLYGEAASANMPSKFLAELPLQFTSNINPSKYESTYTKRLKLTLSVSTWHPDKELKNYLTEIAEKFILSATSFNNYLNCPQSFFYNQFLHVPKVKNFSAAYGSAVHMALELFFKKKIKELKLPSKEFFIESFYEGLKKEILTLKDEKRARTLGKKILSEYYDFYVMDWAARVPIATEFNFKYHNVHFGQIPITGKIDKIEIIDKIGKSVRIIDYKTTSPKSLNYLLGQTRDQDFSYLYQAFFYKLLAENDPLFNWKITEVVFDFITPTNGKFVKVTLPIDPELYKDFLKLVEATYKNILDLKFDLNRDACKNSQFKCEYLNLCETKGLKL